MTHLQKEQVTLDNKIEEQSLGDFVIGDTFESDDSISSLTTSTNEEERLILIEHERNAKLKLLQQQLNALKEKQDKISTKIVANKEAHNILADYERRIAEYTRRLMVLDKDIRDINNELSSKINNKNELQRKAEILNNEIQSINTSPPSFFVRLLTVFLTYLGFNIVNDKAIANTKRASLDSIAAKISELDARVSELNHNLEAAKSEKKAVAINKTDLQIDKMHHVTKEELLKEQQQLEAQLSPIEHEITDLKKQQQLLLDEQQKNSSVARTIRESALARRAVLGEDECGNDSDDEEDIFSWVEQTLPTNTVKVNTTPSFHVELALTPSAKKGLINTLYVEFTDKSIIFSYNEIKNNAFSRSDLQNLLTGEILPPSLKTLDKNFSPAKELVERNRAFFQKNSGLIVQHLIQLQKEKKQQVHIEQTIKIKQYEESKKEAVVAQQALVSNLSKNRLLNTNNTEFTREHISRSSPISITKVASDKSINSLVIKEQMLQTKNKRMALDITKEGCFLFNLSTEIEFNQLNRQKLADKMSSQIALLLVGNRLFSATKGFGGTIKTEELMDTSNTVLKESIRAIEPGQIQMVDKKNNHQLLSQVILCLTGINTLSSTSSETLAGLSDKEKKEATAALLNNDTLKQLKGILIKCKAQGLSSDIRIIDFPADNDDEDVQVERAQRAQTQDLRARLNSLYNEIRDKTEKDFKDLYNKLIEAGYSDLGVTANEKINDAHNTSNQARERKPLPFLKGINKKQTPDEETASVPPARPNGFLDEITKRKNSTETSAVKSSENTNRIK